MKRGYCVLLVALLWFEGVVAQGIGIGTATPDASARVQVSSTSQGMLLPRMSLTQRNAIVNPATGLLVYQTDGAAGFYFYNGSEWTSLSGAAANLQGVPATYGWVSTLAGSRQGNPGGGVGAAAFMSNPFGVAVDMAGNLYVADAGQNRILKVTPGGAVSILAGSGGISGDDGIGLAASFNDPQGIAIDLSGNLYVTDRSNNKIRKITPAGVVSTLAGSGADGSADGPGPTASFHLPEGIAVDYSGVVYVTEPERNRIRRIASDGTVTTFAGSGAGSDIDGVGTGASFYFPTAIGVSPGGDLYVLDLSAVRKVSPGAVVTTLARGYNSNGNGTGTAYGIVVGPDGWIYIACNFIGILKMSLSGAITVLVRTGGTVDGPQGAGGVESPNGMAMGPDGNLYYCDYGPASVRRIFLH
jgi:sugar lactone lactonase YvrE